MIRRIAVSALALIVLAVGSFFGYGWWTRRGAPEFSQGGTFGAPTASPTASAAPAEVRGVQAERGGGDRNDRTTRSDPTAPSSPVGRADAPATFVEPARGTYTYAGAGHEQVRFGPTSACSWDIEDVTAVVKRDAGNVVFDWTYSSQRHERWVMDYDQDAVRLTFAGAAVTCVGIRRTSEESYTPPSTWVKLPLKVGSRWEETTQAGERREEVSARILRRERITVPAGSFDAWVVRSTVRLSGSEEGVLRNTTWFVPRLGLAAKKIQQTDVVSSGAHYTSELTLRLADLPG